MIVFALAGALTSLVGIGSTIVRTKVLARVVGPEGVGISAEVSQVVTLAAMLATVAGGPALLLRIAKADRDADRAALQRALSAGIGLATVLSLLGAVAAVVLAPHVLPRSALYPARLYVGLAAGAAGLGALTGVTQTLFVGTSNLRAMTLLSIAPAVFGAAVSVGLIVPFALTGSFLASAVGAAASLAMSLLYLRWQGGRARVSLRPSIDLGFAKEAIVLGAASLASAYLGQLVLVTVRASLEAVGGAAQGAAYNGNYQAATAVGNTYFTLVLGSLGSYYSPRYAAAATAEELGAHVRHAQSFVLRVAPPVVLTAIAFRRDVIHLLYSQRFDVAIGILGYQLAGDIPKGVSWALGGPLLLRRKVGAFLVLEGIGAGVGALFGALLVRAMGPEGAGLAYLVTYAVYLPCAAIVLRVICGVTVERRPLAFTAAFTALAVAVEWTTRHLPWSRWLLLPGLLLWGWRSGAFERVAIRVKGLRESLRSRRAGRA